MMSTSILEQFAKARVLVIGDMMLDHYLWGDVYRISPEAPVPVVHANHDTYTAGGAANVALNLVNLGVQVTVLGAIANDDAGKRLTQILSDSGVNIEPTQFSAAPTIIKTRVIVRNQQLCRIDREVARDKYRIDLAPNFDDTLGKILANVDAVIISDYAKGVVTQGLVETVLQIASHNKKLLVAVDPKPSHGIFYQSPGLLTPNRSEALEMAGLPHPPAGEPYPLEEVCSIIHGRYKPDLLIITLGAEGMAICQEGKVVKHLATEAREVFDVSGAGDTVIATLTAALVLGMKAAQAAWLANGAAGCVVAHMGTVPVNATELKAWLTEHPFMLDNI